MGRPQGTSGSVHPSGKDRGESIETRSGPADTVSLKSSSSVLSVLVVASAPFITAQPVGRLSLPVRSIPTIRGFTRAGRHLCSNRGAKPSGFVAGAECLPSRRALGNADTPANKDLADVFKNSAVCLDSLS